MNGRLGRRALFWLWALAGGTLALSAVSSIGVLTGPVALVLLFLAARTSPRWPEPLGLATGCGVLCLLVSGLNWHGGGIDPLPWLAAGAVLCVAGLAAYEGARRRTP